MTDREDDTATSRPSLSVIGGTGTHDRAIPPLLLSVDEAAHALSIGQSLLYEILGRGELDVVRLGRRVLVPVKALEAWIEAHTERALATGLATTEPNRVRSGAFSSRTSEVRNRS